MCKIKTLLFLLSSFFGFAQFYVDVDVKFSLVSSETIFTTQESLNTINSSIHGQGLFYFSSPKSQYLNSTLDLLQLPNLHLKNADRVDITTRLEVQHSLVIGIGTLILSRDLYLQDVNALQVLGNGAVLSSASGQLVYKDQHDLNRTLLALSTSTSLLSFVTPSIHRIETRQCTLKSLLCFERLVFCYQMPYLNLSTLPPEHIFI